MVTFKLLNVLLCFFIAVSQGQLSCPFFSYMKDERNDQIYGRIEIPNPPKNVALHLRVSLSVATSLLTKYAGKLVLMYSKQDSIKAINQGSPLFYNIFFPITQPIPQLTEIKFNNHQYCVGSPVIGPVVTNLFLEHFFYPPGVNPLVSNVQPKFQPPTKTTNYFIPIDNLNKFTYNIVPSIPSPPYSQIPPISSLPLPPIPPASTAPPLMPAPVQSVDSPLDDGPFEFDKDCGKPKTAINRLIAKGQKSWPGQWPWLAAIFLTRKKLEFQCAGSLISDRHILTAAHCRSLNGQEIPANNFIVSLGRYQLQDWRETDANNLEVLEIYVHPEYKHDISGHADIALFYLRERLVMNSLIQPLCLWTGPTQLDMIVGHEGYVVGWGRDEKGSQYLSEPRSVQVPIVSQEDCLRSNIAFVLSTSNKTFCAGSRDGSGPCNGDSGSALVILNPFSGRYHLRGVVSLSLLDRETLSCDLSQYVVYVDAAKYVDWIKTEVSAI